MNPIFVFLLDDCFWSFLDAGAAAEQTPLMTRLSKGHPLTETLCRRFGISIEEAEFEITAARSEVEL